LFERGRVEGGTPAAHQVNTWSLHCFLRASHARGVRSEVALVCGGADFCVWVTRGGADSHRLATHSAIRRTRLPGVQGKASPARYD
jgi:hypothetical protein